MKLFLQIFILILFVFTSLSLAQRGEEVHKRNALLHMQAGRYGEAIDQLNKYIAQNARNAEGYNLRGLCFEQREQYQLSVLDLRRATRLDPTNSEYKKNLQRVWEIWREILYARIDGYKREIAIDPDKAFNYLEIGKSYRWLEEWALAELWYDRYLERDDDASPDEIIRYTEILSHTGSIRKGEIILEEFVSRYPEDWRLWSRYGYFTMWLGNYRNAEKAFRTSLSFKPFFKEAQDGLDLALREGYMVQQTPRSFEREEYPIDRYYRVLRNDPNNDEARYMLIQFLMNESRYEEAMEQLQYLAPNHEGTDRFESIKESLMTIRQAYYEEKIDSNQTALKKDPNNRDALSNIVDYYINLEDHESAEELLREYLEMNPDDHELRYKLAQVYSVQRKLNEAQIEIDKAVEANPNNTEYLLLAGQIAVWNNVNLEQGEEYLERVLQNDPNNIDAIIALGTLNFQQQEYETAQMYNENALAMAPDNTDVQQLNSMMELQFIRAEEQRKMEKLEEGRELAMNGYYDEAIPYYEEYFEQSNPTVDLRYELADVYVGADRYYDAIYLYDQTLSEAYDEEKDKLRAKVLYWSGDSVRALDEFERLSEEYPDDPEMQLYLGDSYAQMKMYDSARVVYNRLYDDAPESYIIDERLDWLPTRPEDENFLVRGFRNLGGYVFSYLFFQPVSYYFTDNLDFEYKYWGGNLETSLLPYISVGATWLRGNLANDFGSFYYTTLKGNLFVRPEDNLLFRLSYGEMYSPGIVRSPILEAGVRYDYEPERKGDKFGFDISYTRSDAATLLYSPGLVFTRLTGQLLSFNGYYEFETNVRLEAIYNLMHTKEGSAILGPGITQLPSNLGNSFTGRVGRWFYPNLIAGYEYYFTDFQRTLPVYYSPQDFHQHSIYLEWYPLKDERWDIMIGGKLGYIPQYDYILRELKTRIIYSVTNNLRFLLTGYLSNTFREQIGYSSGSISLSAQWSIF